MKNDWNTSSAQELNKNKRFFYLCFVFFEVWMGCGENLPDKVSFANKKGGGSARPLPRFSMPRAIHFSDWESSSAQNTSKTVSFFTRVSFLDVLAP